ncbi:MAG: response regulator [Ignavibacteria bacterium]
MKKILVVEDEKELSDNIRILLEAEGYSVILVENGLEALKVIDKENPDLIISDIMMPFMNGYELFETVKEDLKTKIIPFIFLTAKNDMPALRYGMNLGADDYLIKPFTPEDLLQSIKTCFSKSQALSRQLDEIRENISHYIPHELRTPLVSILGFSEIIISDIDALEKNEILSMVRSISSGAERLHKRIEKFIELISLEPIADNFWVNGNKKGCINESVIKGIIQKNNIIADRKEKINLSVESADLIVPSAYLEILIRELLENAVKFSEPGKAVFIHGAKADKLYQIKIQDYGMGMSKSEISRIGVLRQFEREKYHQEGNGLGLAIVKKILNKCGGTLNIESEKLKYTNVNVNVPLFNKLNSKL